MSTDTITTTTTAPTHTCTLRRDCLQLEEATIHTTPERESAEAVLAVYALDQERLAPAPALLVWKDREPGYHGHSTVLVAIEEAINGVPVRRDAIDLETQHTSPRDARCRRAGSVAPHELVCGHVVCAPWHGVG